MGFDPFNSSACCGWMAPRILLFDSGVGLVRDSSTDAVRGNPTPLKSDAHHGDSRVTRLSDPMWREARGCQNVRSICAAGGSRSIDPSHEMPCKTVCIIHIYNIMRYNIIYSIYMYYIFIVVFSKNMLFWVVCFCSIPRCPETLEACKHLFLRTSRVLAIASEDQPPQHTQERIISQGSKHLLSRYLDPPNLHNSRNSVSNHLLRGYVDPSYAVRAA